MSQVKTPENAPSIWQVGDLCRAVAGMLGSRFNPVAVRGEISGFARAASGHCYFSLKDETGQLRCVMFRRASSLLDFSPQDGEQVELRGRLSVYELRGELQLIVESMSRAGLGALFEQFVRLKARLEAEGLFDPSRKRILPSMPRAIGVITSLGAAALHDVVSTLQRRAPHIPVIVVPASVQGSLASVELVKALHALYGMTNQVDVILLVRGGGSLEDLWSFNDESLIRALAQSPVPVVSGVGHETDFTLADFVADVRAPTPTAAAELVAQPQSVLLQALAATRARLKQAKLDCLDDLSQRLDGLQDRLGRPSEQAGRHGLVLSSIGKRMALAAKHCVREHRKDLDERQTKFPQQVRSGLNATQHRLERSALRLGLLDPSLVLQRGYAWVSDERGVTVTSVHALVPGQKLHLQLAHGKTDVQVLGGQKKGRTERPLS